MCRNQLDIIHSSLKLLPQEEEKSVNIGPLPLGDRLSVVVRVVLHAQIESHLHVYYPSMLVIMICIPKNKPFEMNYSDQVYCHLLLAILILYKD